MRDDAVMLAHQAVAPSDLAASWRIEPILLALLVVTAAVYARGTARLGRRIAGTDRVGRAVAFHAGLVVVAAAVMSPLDAAAGSLFSAHMVQHLLLMVVAAPLLAWSRPVAALVAGLPAPARDAVRRTVAGPLRPALRRLLHPATVWITGTIALWAWHMPALYESALDHDALHAAEHASFVATALLFWAVVFASNSRRGVARPVALGLVFVTGVQSTALGAVLVFATTPLYQSHATGAQLWDVSLLHDQQLAGALMWAPPAVLYVLTMGWLLVRWFAEMDRASTDRHLVQVGDAG